jgi:hypothetical protein
MIEQGRDRLRLPPPQKHPSQTRRPARQATRCATRRCDAPGGAPGRPPRAAMPVTLAPVLLALPWIAAPLVLAWRLRDSDSLDAYPAAAPADAPPLS